MKTALQLQSGTYVDVPGDSVGVTINWNEGGSATISTAAVFQGLE